MNIQEQIEALTQELKPYPANGIMFYYYDQREDRIGSIMFVLNCDSDAKDWRNVLSASTNKAEVEEYADCYRRLKLYQLLGKKAEKEHPLDWDGLYSRKEGLYGTDFNYSNHLTGMVFKRRAKTCVLGGVWFARNEDRLEALKICGIDKAFQEKCAKYGLGGA